MKKSFLILSISLLFLFVLGVSQVFAEAKPLVHCGLVEENGIKACTFCDIFVMFQGWYNGMMTVVLPTLAAFMIVIAGVSYMLSQGQPEKLLAVRKIFTSIAIGLFIAYAAWIIIELFLMTIGVVGWTGLANGGWSSINCGN